MYLRGSQFQCALLSALLVFWAHSAALAQVRGCGPSDRDCSRRILRILSGIQIGEVNVDAGERFGDGAADQVIRLSTTAVASDAPMGDLEIGTFEVNYEPEKGAWRIGLTAAESGALFLCVDNSTGEISIPHKSFNCRVDATWGMSGKILQFQDDVGEEGRKALRWAELNVVWNFLHNAYSMDYLQERLVAVLGGSLETVYGNAGTATTGRLNMGLSGMIRSENNHVELRAFAGYRPAITDWDNTGFEARSEILYNVLFSKNWLGTFGVAGEYDRWSKPELSIGPHASALSPNSYFIGLMFRLMNRYVGGGNLPPR